MARQEVRKGQKGDGDMSPQIETIMAYINTKCDADRAELNAATPKLSNCSKIADFLEAQKGINGIIRQRSAT
jgi:hypothetical protein